MISKELLSEVLDIKINMVMNPKKTPNHLQTSNELTYFDENNFVNQINIYELAHKCKEWSDKNGYTLNSWVASFTTDEVLGWCELRYERTGKVVKKCPVASADTAPEAIFKACEWILNETT